MKDLFAMTLFIVIIITALTQVQKKEKQESAKNVDHLSRGIATDMAQ